MLVSTARVRAATSPMYLLASAALLALLITCLFFIASWYSLGRGGSERVAEAFQSNALGTEIWGDQVSGRHRLNDCLITALALEQRQPPSLLFVSPVNTAQPVDDVCTDLRDGTGPNVAAYYHNYLHGHAVLLRYLIPHFSIEAVKDAYKTLASLLLLAGTAVCMSRLSKRAKGEEPLILLIAMLGFARFFGLEWFGQSLSHGPSDIILIAFVVLIAFRAASLSLRKWVMASAIFGTLTMIFELLTGGLPLGASVVIGLGWFGLREEDRSFRSVGLGLVAYGMGALVSAIVKITLVAWLFGSEALVQVFGQGLSRMGSAVPAGWADQSALSQLILHIGSLAPGLPLLALGMLCLALMMSLVGAVRHPEPQSLLLLGSILPIAVWFMLFRQHTALHAWFMARILVWPVIAGFALFALTAIRANHRSVVVSGTETVPHGS